MANIEYLIKNINHASEEALRRNQNDIGSALIASDDFMRYSIFVDRLGIDPSTDVEKHMLERAQVERSKLNSKKRVRGFSQTINGAESRLRERAHDILRDFNRSEVYLKSLISRIHGTEIKGQSVDNMSYGQLVNIGESILQRAKRYS